MYSDVTDPLEKYHFIFFMQMTGSIRKITFMQNMTGSIRKIFHWRNILLLIFKKVAYYFTHVSKSDGTHWGDKMLFLFKKIAFHFTGSIREIFRRKKLPVLLFKKIAFYSCIQK